MIISFPLSYTAELLQLRNFQKHIFTIHLGVTSFEPKQSGIDKVLSFGCMQLQTILTLSFIIQNKSLLMKLSRHRCVVL
jgi:hypothetical protein